MCLVGPPPPWVQHWLLLLTVLGLIWNPQQQTQIKQIEQFQRNAARFVVGRPFNPHQLDSVSSIISSLQWPSLQSQQQRADIILLYRVVHSLVSVPHSTRQSNHWKFIQPHCRVNVYQHSFFPSTTPVWNALPTSVVTARAWTHSRWQSSLYLPTRPKF